MRNFVAVIWLFSITFDVTLAVTIYGECFTPKSEKGVCVEVKECEELFALISDPIPESDKDYLLRSQCSHPSAFLVCCPTRNVLIPKPPACGTVLDDFIIGGEETKITEYPWMALIEYTNKSNNSKDHHCAGALISDRYVLTAAHCVEPFADWTLTGVRLGEWDTSTDPDCEEDIKGNRACAPPHQDISIEEITPHRLFDSRRAGGMHDIALIRLARKVTFSNFIKPICLPAEPDQQNDMFVNDSMYVAGWGKTGEYAPKSTIKLKALLTVRTIDDCQRPYATQGIRINTNHICAAGPIGVDSCKGDSGGPLFSRLKSSNGLKAYYITGIVAFGHRACGVSGWPSVYTRVGAYMDWISHTIRA